MNRWIRAFAVVILVVIARASQAAEKPNIVLILADDLGIGEVGCYGQEKIRTPNIDALAKGGIKFTTAYSPSPVCAPTRCSLLTGLHQGHAAVRGNREIQPEGQEPMPADTVTIAKVLHDAGYATACVGKWGLGPVGSASDPLKMGFDFFYGHNCQRWAHNHYTDHVWKNDQRIDLEGNKIAAIGGKYYTPDLMADEAIGWLKQQKGPFFLYFATPLPHVSLQAPAEAVAQYEGKLGDEVPFVQKGKVGAYDGYVSCETPHATYAAMVTKVDEYVGRIIRALKEMGVEENTLVVFASDNGATFKIGGADSAFFNSAMGRRGLKEDVYEGGIRVPLVVRWPGKVKEGGESGFTPVLYDLPATFCEVAGTQWPTRTDGVSILPAVTGKGEQKGHDYYYFELEQRGGQKAVRKGDWKAVWVGLKKDPKAKGELYDLAKDPNETTDVSAQHPDVMAEMLKIRESAREKSAVGAWNF